mmetsp:Transcript_3574/g.13066  ORF Transcript_3574/g.13066 Transcript_3574/m.13066 type:complete len:177 (-) Transcript_3574:121-651(-)
MLAVKRCQQRHRKVAECIVGSNASARHRSGDVTPQVGPPLPSSALETAMLCCAAVDNAGIIEVEQTPALDVPLPDAAKLVKEEKLAAPEPTKVEEQKPVVPDPAQGGERGATVAGAGAVGNTTRTEEPAKAEPAKAAAPGAPKAEAPAKAKATPEWKPGFGERINTFLQGFEMKRK